MERKSKRKSEKEEKIEIIMEGWRKKGREEKKERIF